MMKPLNDGGPAFPRPVSANPTNGDMVWEQEGMTLRDYFAAKALQGLLAMCAGEHINSGTPAEVAKYAYEHADAMIARRELRGAL